MFQTLLVALSLLGPVLAPFDPPDHYGIDIGIPVGSVVEAAWPGEVTFWGQVTDFEAVTVALGGAVKTTYSFLELAPAVPGRVSVGTVLGAAGSGEHAGYHLSVRVEGTYVDPVRLMSLPPPASALSLVSPPVRRSHNLS